MKYCRVCCSNTNFSCPSSSINSATTSVCQELQPLFGYSGIKGRTIEGPMKLSNANQQARQMDAFAECILEDKKSRVPGEMGLQDVRTLMAIVEAASTGKKVNLG